jgi:hypothetical protein
MVDAQATVAIAKGDRIKMTAATLRMLENNPNSVRRYVKWKQRRGTVVRVSRPTQCVCIKGPGHAGFLAAQSRRASRAACAGRGGN